jgi:hypothetical protein
MESKKLIQRLDVWNEKENNLEMGCTKSDQKNLEIRCMESEKKTLEIECMKWEF